MASTTVATSHIISNLNLGATGGLGVDLIVYGDTSGNYIQWDASANKLISIGALDVGVDGTGHDVTLYGDTSGSYLQWDMSDDRLEGVGTAKIQIGESTTGVTAAGGSTMIYGYASHGTNALTGDAIGVRGNARVNVNSSSGKAIGGHFIAGNGTDGYNLSVARGIYAGVVNKAASGSSATWTDARGVEVIMDLDQGTSGHTNTITNACMFYGVYNLPTSGSYSTVTNGYGIYVVNEAVGGTGQQLDAAFYAKGLNQSGGIVAWDYGLYLLNCKRPVYTEATCSGSSAINANDFVVTDTTTGSEGYMRGLYVNMTSTGTKTGTGETNAVGIDLTQTGNAWLATPLSLYTAGCGSAVIPHLWGIYLYMDDIGGSATVTSKVGLNIGIDNGDNAATCSFFRLYNHGSAGTDIDYVFDMPNGGINPAQYWWHAGCTGDMIEIGDITNGKSCTHGLRCQIASTVVVIPLYED